MTNKATLTFAGDSKKLESAVHRVGASVRMMNDKVKDSSDVFGKARAGVGRFKEGVDAAGKMAIPAAATAAAAMGAAVAPALAFALAGGVVLALGGGVLVAGIIAAVKTDTGVQKAFGGLADKA